MRTSWRIWATKFASSLLGDEVEFIYDQFLAKPPRIGTQTPWHQDEAYWGKNYPDAGITCWMPFHDVDSNNGCIEFIKAGHLDGIHNHQRINKSDALACPVDETRIITCPLKLGSVSFHHSKTPHSAKSNISASWRKVLSQHFRLKSFVHTRFPNAGNYPWRYIEKQGTI